MCRILLLCCLLLMWPRRPEPRGSAAPPPRSPSARTLEPWRHASGWTCHRAQDEDEEDETAAEEGGVLLETINSCRPTFPPTFDTSHVVCGGLSLPRCTYAPLDVYGGKLRQVREKMSTKMRRRIQIFSTLQFRKPLAMKWKSAITNRRWRFRS